MSDVTRDLQSLLYQGEVFFDIWGNDWCLAKGMSKLNMRPNQIIELEVLFWMVNFDGLLKYKVGWIWLNPLFVYMVHLHHPAGPWQNAVSFGCTISSYFIHPRWVWRNCFQLRHLWYRPPCWMHSERRRKLRQAKSQWNEGRFCDPVRGVSVRQSLDGNGRWWAMFAILIRF